MKFLDIVSDKVFTKGFDLYICAMGFEDRSLESNLDINALNFTTKKTLLIEYDINKIENARNRSTFLETINGFSEEVTSIEYSYTNRMKFYNEFKDFFLRGDNYRICLNITSLATHLMAIIIDAIIGKFVDLKVIYSSPKSYYSTVGNEESFSQGLNEVFTLPGYQGSIITGYPLVLVLLLGFDILRPKGIVSILQPAKKYGIISQSNTDKDLFDNIREIHFRNLDPINLESVDKFDINNLTKKLDKIRDDNIETSNISLILDSSKIHSLVAILFAKKRKDVQLVFSTPIQYFPQKYSTGISDTHCIEIPKIW